jgi:hypothetical protein
MIDILTITASALIGGAGVYLYLRPKLIELARLTDRDDRGRYVRREP